MASLKTLATRRTDVFHIDAARLVVIPGFNIRSENNYGDLDALARSIRSEGVREPLHGYKTDKDQFAITQGHRRERAITRALAMIDEDLRKARIDEDKPRIKALNAEKALVSTVPVISEEQGKSDTDRLYDQFTLNDGIPLGVLDEAEGFQRLMKTGESEAVILRRRGCSKTHFHNCMLLLNEGAPKVLDFVRQGRVAASLAIELVRKVKDKTEQVKLIEAAAAAVKPGAKITGKNLDESTRSKVAPSKTTAAKAGGGGGGGGSKRKATIEKTEDPLDVPLPKKTGVEAKITVARLSTGSYVVGVMLRYEGAKEFTGIKPDADGDTFPNRNAAELEGIQMVKDNVLAAQRTATKDFKKVVKFDEAIETLARMVEARTTEAAAPGTSGGRSTGETPEVRSQKSEVKPEPADVPGDTTHDADEESLVPADTAEPVRHIIALRDALRGDKRMKKKLGSISYVTLNFVADYLGGGRYKPEEFEKFFTQFVISGKQSPPVSSKQKN
jgi:ParB-like chromosome segregation protein Spo0J